MKLTDLKPNTVYMLTPYDHIGATRDSRQRRYAATGDTAEIIITSERGKDVKRAVFHQVDVESPECGKLQSVRTIFGVTEHRRGVSIIDKVCAVEDWPAKMAELHAQQVERAQRASEQAEEDRERRVTRDKFADLIVKACKGLGVEVEEYTGWVRDLAAESYAPAIVAAIETAAKVEP